VYLPEVDVQSGVVCGYEALLRWNRGQASSVSAGEFLHILEESGDIIEVGKWIVEQVCAEASALLPNSPMRLSINISARELVNPAFVSIIENALRSHGLHGSRLELEI